METANEHDGHLQRTPLLGQSVRYLALIRN
jgi:hypothetical protein